MGNVEKKYAGVGPQELNGKKHKNAYSKLSMTFFLKKFFLKIYRGIFVLLRNL
jgi:hypothetical protein